MSRPLVLLESTALDAPRIDRERGIVYGVKVLGRVSKNHKTYSDASLADVVRLAEGVTVYKDHPDAKFAGRPVARNLDDRFGVLRGLYRKPDGVYARELRYNPHHEYASTFLWEAEHAPRGGIGLSLNGHSTKYSRRHDGSILVERVEQVFSVDLVSGPATTGGLFEQALPRTPADVKAILLGEPGEPSRYEKALAGMRSDLLAGRPLINGRADLSRIKKALVG